MSTVDIRGSTVEKPGGKRRFRWHGGKRTVAVQLCALVGAGVLLAACGSGTTASPSGTSGSNASQTLAVKHQNGIGTMLVDSSGKTVYFTSQEANGKIACTSECLSFWHPVLASGSTPPTVSGVTGLTVVHRTDNNQEQLAYQGKPLYTFVQDSSSGDVSGNNFMDSFGGTDFTWHVATVTGSAGAPAPAPSTTMGGTTSGGGGGYSGY